MSDKKNNTGKDNTGENNSGDWNSGNRNSGNWNSGNRNSGNRNSGYGNSGDWNSGDWNSGYGNSGNGNSGYGNSSNRQAGIFNSTETTVRMFNKETNLTWDEIDHPDLDEFYLNKWMPESQMTDQEKKDDPQFFVREGYLKTFTWTEEWANFWKDTSEENRQKFLNLPNFDPSVFKEITGIDTEITEESIEIEGKKYTLSEIKKALGK